MIHETLFKQTKQDPTIFFTWKNSEMFNITSKYLSIFNNTPPASWVAHITRDFLTCYTCHMILVRLLKLSRSDQVGPLEMIFLNQVSQKSSISHHSPHHKARKDHLFWLKKPHHHQYTPIHFIEILFPKVWPTKHTRKPSTVKKETHPDFFIVIITDEIKHCLIF